MPLVAASTLALAQPTAEPIRLALIEGLSGPFTNAGEAVFRNLLLATERINKRGGVRVAGVTRPLALVRMDSKGNAEDALGLLRGALDQRIGIVLQGNSSATAAALVNALDKHNERQPQRRALFLNYSAVDPALTNERCSFWHFRFDAHADMRLAALTDVLRDDRAVHAAGALPPHRHLDRGRRGLRTHLFSARHPAHPASWTWPRPKTACWWQTASARVS